MTAHEARELTSQTLARGAEYRDAMRRIDEAARMGARRASVPAMISEKSCNALREDGFQVSYQDGGTQFDW